jgi:Carboxypeptidase regulatory-like domain
VRHVELIARALATIVLCTGAIVRASAQAPARDAVRPPSVGTAVIAGTIVTDDKDRRPLRRARVALMTAEHENGRSVVTDDEGRFAFRNVAPGRYLLSAKKPGYVTLEYGAKRAARPGVALVVEDGKQLTIVMPLPRGAVIAGTIVDQNGQPVSTATVQAIRFQFNENGRRSLAPTEHSAETNDLGQYRIWGLDAGEYVVAAWMPENADLVRLTEADINQAEADVTGGVTRATASRPRRAAYAQVYYPGTFATSEASSVRLIAGEERIGIDFPVSLTSTAKVEGTVIVPDGLERRGVFVQMGRSDTDDNSMGRPTTTAEVGDDGRFSISGLSPGQYVLTARAEAPQRGPGGVGFGAFTPSGPTHWAIAEVSVSGDDISGVSLVLQPTFTVTGKIRIEGSRAQPDMSVLLVILASAQPSMNNFFAPPSPVDANGTFTIAGVTPGRYQVHARVMTMRGADDVWQVKSTTVNGRETADEFMELRTGVDGVVVTLTDRMPGVSGIVRDGAGQAVAGCDVVVFAKDRKFWTPNSTRIASAHPASDGEYRIRSVPPGDYFIAAVNDLEPGEWFAPSLLEQLSKAAVSVTLSEGDKKTQDLRLIDRR